MTPHFLVLGNSHSLLEDEAWPFEPCPGIRCFAVNRIYKPPKEYGAEQAEIYEQGVARLVDYLFIQDAEVFAQETERILRHRPQLILEQRVAGKVQEVLSGYPEPDIVEVRRTTDWSLRRGGPLTAIRNSVVNVLEYLYQQTTGRARIALAGVDLGWGPDRDRSHTYGAGWEVGARPWFLESERWFQGHAEEFAEGGFRVCVVSAWRDSKIRGILGSSSLTEFREEARIALEKPTD